MLRVLLESTFPLVARYCRWLLMVGETHGTCITRMNSLNTLGDALNSAVVDVATHCFLNVATLALWSWTTSMSRTGRTGHFDSNLAIMIH